MESNGELLRRAKRTRQLRGPDGNGQPKHPAEQRSPAHVSRHASYTALMRSHDRMRSRHTGGQG